MSYITIKSNNNAAFTLAAAVLAARCEVADIRDHIDAEFVAYDGDGNIGMVRDSIKARYNCEIKGVDEELRQNIGEVASTMFSIETKRADCFVGALNEFVHDCLYGSRNNIVVKM